MDVPPSPPHSDDVVSASDLVRRFGLWRDRALASPVYVLHRGKPRLVLAAADLIGRGTARPGDTDRVSALLDGSPEMIVIADRHGALIAASRSVRTRFGDPPPGSPVAALVAPEAAAPLAAAIGRVAETGLAETVELGLAGLFPSRATVAIEPHPDGVALFAREVAPDDRDSFDATFAASRHAAVARLDAHGFLDGPHTALAALTGIAPAILSSLRFVSLFAVESRTAIAAAIDATGETGLPQSVAASLLTEAGDPRPVSVAFAPRLRGDSAAGVVALILATS
jgi:hypothetical protein